MDNLGNLKLDAGRCVLVVGLRAALVPLVPLAPLAPIGMDCVVLSSTTPGARVAQRATRMLIIGAKKHV